MTTKINTYNRYKLWASKNIKIKRLNFNKIDDRFYYIYRITHTTTNQHYYGSRVSFNKPNLDLGQKYFSSSKRKEHIKIFQRDYKFKILKVFNNNGDKVLYESFIHQYFDVKNNESFFNESNQLPWGFDVTNKDRNITGILKYKQTVALNEWKNTIGKNKISKMLDGRDFNLIGSKISKTMIENGTSVGSQNGKSKIINIYDAKDNLVFVCHGNFNLTCKENNLPINFLRTSYRNNTKLGYSKMSRTLIAKQNMSEFNGWYAKELM